MKKIFSFILFLGLLSLVTAPLAHAEDEKCRCGTDEDGECLPCE